MILIDFSMVATVAAFAGIKALKDAGEWTEEAQTLDFTRKVVLTGIGNAIRQHKQNYGKVVICCDSKDLWRKKFFPYYKASRGKQRDASELDFSKFHQHIDIIKEEIAAVFPMKLIAVDTCEADDVIAVLAKFITTNTNEPILIVSRDGDFKQLQTFSNVKQFCPVMGKLIVETAPESFRLRKIITGDTGDGVPNILSEDATLVTPGMRQPPMTAKRMSYFLNTPIADWEDKAVIARYNRNKYLVDLIDLPPEVVAIVVEKFKSTREASGSQLLTYFIKNRLRNLIENISDFTTH